MSNIIVVANQKGGVGKTTTVINLASALYEKPLRRKVLVIDTDPQGNATTGSGLDKNQLKHTIYDVLVNGVDIQDAIVKSESCGFDVLPANRHLSGAEIELVDFANREYILRDALNKIKDKYDIILIDCPPSLSLLTLNALSAANSIIAPIQCEYYALEGLSDLINTIQLIQKKLNPQLQIMGILRTMYDKRNNLAQQVSRQLEDYFAKKMFTIAIPRTVRLAEAPSYGASAVVIDGNSIGAEAYFRLAKEVTKRLI